MDFEIILQECFLSDPLNGVVPLNKMASRAKKKKKKKKRNSLNISS